RSSAASGCWPGTSRPPSYRTSSTASGRRAAANTSSRRSRCGRRTGRQRGAGRTGKGKGSGPRSEAAALTEGRPHTGRWAPSATPSQPDLPESPTPYRRTRSQGRSPSQLLPGGQVAIEGVVRGLDEVGSADRLTEKLAHVPLGPARVVAA